MLVDLADMPGFNPSSNRGTGAHAQRDVSAGRVSLHPQHKVACSQHGAMNCVNPERTIWRCLTCHVAGYVPRPDELPQPTVGLVRIIAGRVYFESAALLGWFRQAAYAEEGAERTALFNAVGSLELTIREILRQGE